MLHSSSVAFGFSDLFSKAVYDLSDHHQLKAVVVVGGSKLERAAEELGDLGGLGVATHGGWLAATWRHVVSPRVTLTHQAFATGESYRNDTGEGTTAARGLARNTGYRLDSAVTPPAGPFIEAGVSIERSRADQLHLFRVPGWRILGGEDFNRSTDTAGAYGQLHWTTGALTVTPGARVDHFALTGDWVSSPWLQLEWQRAAGLRLVGGAGLAHQFPAMAVIVGRRGNPNLRPERDLLVDAGIEGRLGAATRWQVSAYDRQERDLIDLPGQYFQVVNGVLRPPSSTTLWANGLERPLTRNRIHAAAKVARCAVGLAGVFAGADALR